MTFLVGSCKVKIGFFFIAAIAAILTFDSSRAAAVGLLCAGIHEAAHIAAMKAVGESPKEMSFTVFGIDLVKTSSAERSYKKDALVSFAGPLANLFLGLLSDFFLGKRFFFFTVANLLLFGLNILPIAPLDGGQALNALLCLHISPEGAARTVAAVSFVALVPLAIAGFLLLLRSHCNFTLLLAVCYLTALLLLKKER